MSVREFDGTDDRLVVDDGIIGQLGNGAYTLLALVKPTALNAGEAYISCQAGSSFGVVLYDNAGGGGSLAVGDDNEYIDGSVGETASDWQILAVTCAGPGNAPRFHRKVLGSGSWTRVNAGTNWTGNTVDCTEVEFGSTNNGAFSSFKDFRIAVAAVWNSALSDGTLDTLESTATTAHVESLTPLGLWQFNQATVGTAVLDHMGNGADQTTITGTTVIGGDDPAWTFQDNPAPSPGINYDSTVESVRTGTEDPYTFDFTPTNQPKGVVLVATHGTSSTDHITSVTCDGVAMSRVITATDTATEPGRVDIWFLGAGVPSGTLTFSIDFSSATTDDIHFVAIALTTDAGGDVVVVDSDKVENNVADPSVTLQYGNRECIAIAGLYGGGAAPSSFTPNGNCTTVHDHDLGAFYSEVIRQTTPGTSDFAIGGTAVSDDVAFAAAAFAEQIILPRLTMPPLVPA